MSDSSLPPPVPGGSEPENGSVPPPNPHTWGQGPGQNPWNPAQGQNPWGPGPGQNQWQQGQGPWTQQPPTWQGPPNQGKKRTTALVVTIATVLAVILLGVAAYLLVTRAMGSSASSVLSTCTSEVRAADSATLSADEESILYSTGKSVDSSDLLMQRCLLRETGAPSAVERRIGNTRALDGTQEATWEGWTAFWTYHPDNGLDITFSTQ